MSQISHIHSCCQTLVFDHSIALPRELALIIFELAKTNLDIMVQVSKNWEEMANDDELYQRIYPRGANGAKAYEEILKKAHPEIEKVDAGEELRLPKGVYGFLEEKKYKHVITFIPEEIKVLMKNGEVKIIVLDSLEAVGNFFKKPVTDLESCFTGIMLNRILIEKRPPKKRHWSFICKESMHKWKPFSEQLRLCENRIARLMDTLISALMLYARSECMERIFIAQGQQHDWLRFIEEDVSTQRRLGLSFRSEGFLIHMEHLEYADPDLGVAPARTYYG